MLKYVHVIINSAYTSPYINLVKENFDFEEHAFFVVRGWSESKVKIPVGNNIYPITNKKNILNGFKLISKMNQSKKIFFHGLFTPYLLLILIIHPWLLKKSNWIIWGSDLYEYKSIRDTIFKKLEEFFRRIVFSRFAEITTVIKGDYDLAKKWYKVKGVHKYAMYSVPLKLNQIDEITGSVVSSKDTNFTSILIGNSSDPGNYHYEIFDILTKYKSDNIKIYALLNYGDKAYAQEVIAYGKTIFGESFIGVTDYMEFKDFVLFMNDIDIIVFNHKRQQALGNLLLAYYLEKKIFLNTNSTLYEYFKQDLCLTINSTLDIQEMEFNNFKYQSKQDAANNKIGIQRILEKRYIIDQWSALFDK